LNVDKFIRAINAKKLAMTTLMINYGRKIIGRQTSDDGCCVSTVWLYG